MAELVTLDANVIALQEAPDEARAGEPLAEHLRRHTGYPHALHRAYPPEPDDDERPEGLALLSRLPVHSVSTSWDGGRATANSWALRAALGWDRAAIGLTTVHLDYRGTAGREAAIVSMVDDLIGREPSEYEILCGDFNDHPDSGIGRYLEGRAELDGSQTEWRDLAVEGHARAGELAPTTIGFRRGNPRLQVFAPEGLYARFDRIYLRKGAASDDLTVERAGLLGTEPRTSEGFTPSDHHGVFVDLERVTRSRATGQRLTANGQRPTASLRYPALRDENDAAVVGTAAAGVGHERAAAADERHPLGMRVEDRKHDLDHVEDLEVDHLNAANGVRELRAVLHRQVQGRAYLAADQRVEGSRAEADVVDMGGEEGVRAAPTRPPARQPSQGAWGSGSTQRHRAARCGGARSGARS